MLTRRRWDLFAPSLSLAVLEEDADEVLLSLLARDAEPPPARIKPHRRWVHPPAYGYSPDGVWRRVLDDWWTCQPWQEYQDEIARVAAREPEPEPEPEKLSDWLFQALAQAGEHFQLWRYQQNGVTFAPETPVRK